MPKDISVLSAYLKFALPRFSMGAMWTSQYKAMTVQLLSMITTPNQMAENGLLTYRRGKVL